MFDQTAFEMIVHTFYDAYHLVIQYFHTADLCMDYLCGPISMSGSPQKKVQLDLNALLASMNFGEIITLHENSHIHYQLFIDDRTPAGIFCIGPYMPTGSKNDVIDKNDASGLEDASWNHLRISKKINDLQTLCIARNLLNSLFAYDAIVIKLVELGQPDTSSFSDEAEQHAILQANLVEDAQLHENKLLSHISNSNVIKAQKEMKYLEKLDMFFLNMQYDSLAHRPFAYSVNTLFRYTCHQDEIDAVALEKTSHLYAKRISRCTSNTELDHLLSDMVVSYCTLTSSERTKIYPDTEIQNIMQYILQNLSSAISTKEIASHMHVSTQYLSKTFKQKTGITIRQAITVQRIELSKKLLLDSPMNIKKVANFVGIPDWSYFCKLFVKKTGTAPTVWREQHLKKENVMPVKAIK